MHVGYARVSTLEQDLSAQREALERLGVENKNIYFDHGLTGTTRARPGLREALAATRDGDTLVVTKLDRLARSLKDLVNLVNEIQEKGGALHSLNDQIDTTTPHGKFTFHVFAALAEFERDIIRERTKAGLTAARARGRVAAYWARPRAAGAAPAADRQAAAGPADRVARGPLVDCSAHSD